MPTFVMATRLEPMALKSPKSLERIQNSVMEHIRLECAGVEFRIQLAVLGKYDYVEVFDAPDNDTAMKVATITRTFGHALTEVWPAKEWSKFKEMLRGLPSQEGGV